MIEDTHDTMVMDIDDVLNMEIKPHEDSLIKQSLDLAVRDRKCKVVIYTISIPCIRELQGWADANDCNFNTVTLPSGEVKSFIVSKVDWRRIAEIFHRKHPS